MIMRYDMLFSQPASRGRFLPLQKDVVKEEQEENTLTIDGTTTPDKDSIVLDQPPRHIFGLRI